MVMKRTPWRCKRLRDLRLVDYNAGRTLCPCCQKRMYFPKLEAASQYRNAARLRNGRARKIFKARATMDHIVPRARGGPDTDENTMLICASCNNAKGNKFPLSFWAWVEREYGAPDPDIAARVIAANNLYHPKGKFHGKN